MHATLSTPIGCLIPYPVTLSSMKRVYRVSTLPTYIITISVDLFTFTRFIHSGWRRCARGRTSPTKLPVAVDDSDHFFFFDRSLSAPRSLSMRGNRRSPLPSKTKKESETKELRGSFGVLRTMFDFMTFEFPNGNAKRYACVALKDFYTQQCKDATELSGKSCASCAESKQFLFFFL